MDAAPDTTLLLAEARAGSREAADRLFAHVYDALRDLAHRRLRRHRPGETLDTTALVHEAYLRLAGADLEVESRAHFLALAARAMRFVLVDYARARAAAKRGGAHGDLPLDAIRVAAEERAADLLALDEALRHLEAHDTHLARVVEGRFFGGLSYADLAALTGRSVPSLERDWQRARAWLHRAMQGDGPDEGPPTTP